MRRRHVCFTMWKYLVGINMQEYFRELSQKIFAFLSAEETLLLNLEGESSDFVRLNHNRVRQAGHVNQQVLAMTLVARQRQSIATLDLVLDLRADLDQAGKLLSVLREQLSYLPEDPYINFNNDPCFSEFLGTNNLPPTFEALDEVIQEASGLDLVGIWASGEVNNGFANSLGQFNWHSNYNFSLDWSIYTNADKAVKQNYAGTRWDSNIVQQKINFARDTLPLLKASPKTINPGYYQAYFAPSALNELTELLSWGGFGIKSHRTAHTPLLKMIEEGKTLHSKINFVENHQSGLKPQFTQSGFMKPEQVTLIDNGVYQDCLVDARSAGEYSVAVNCDVERPQALTIAAGDLSENRILSELGTGIYISDLWYCNYSDRNNCRITGMTRFACLWVEAGKVVAPLDVMRFDDSIYHILGDKLVALTKAQEQIVDTASYEKRSQSCALLPGALVADFHLTL